MDKSYNFSQNKEPTTAQLEELMLAVSKDVKERALRAEEKYKLLQSQALQQTLEIWKHKQIINDRK